MCVTAAGSASCFVRNHNDTLLVCLISHQGCSITHMSPGKVFTPLLPPDRLYRKDPLPPLTLRERTAYLSVFEHFSRTGYQIPSIAHGELTEDEKFWLSYECILRSVLLPYFNIAIPIDCLLIFRFLRGSRWKPHETIKRLENTLKWRREFGFYTHLTPGRVEKEVCRDDSFLEASAETDTLQAQSGTQIILGYDTQGCPAFYMIPSKQIWNESRCLQYTVFMLERCIDLMPPGVEYVLSSFLP